MKIVSPETRKLFGGYGPCPWCGKQRWLECAHVFAKGMGNASQLDISINRCP